MYKDKKDRLRMSYFSKFESEGNEWSYIGYAIK